MPGTYGEIEKAYTPDTQLVKDYFDRMHKKYDAQMKEQKEEYIGHKRKCGKEQWHEQI